MIAQPPAIAPLKWIGLLQRYFCKGLAETPIIVGPHCCIPKPHAHQRWCDAAMRNGIYLWI